MTLIVAWAGVDTHGPSSVYLASDSRISWRSGDNFDYGRKVFACSNWPDVLGYCGDVLFPSIALNQIVELADAGLLFHEAFTPRQKFQAIVDKLNDLFREYPALHAGLAENSLSVVHASRDPANPKRLGCNTISWTSKNGWRGDEREMPTQSDVLFALGSGAEGFNANFQRYRTGPTGGTSRAVFHCFCDTLAAGGDATIGGAPQLVGIIRKPRSPAFNVGLIYGSKRFFLGARVDNLRNFATVEWRNREFELCDGATLKRFPDAQRQPDPLRRL